jgi:HSP20 family protein
MENTQELTRKEKKELEGAEQVRPGRYYVPDVDIFETADALWLWADVPGADPGKVSVELNNDVLTLQAEVGTADYEGLSPAYIEYNVGNYRRQFTVPNGGQFDRNGITARLVDGVLEVKLPKAEAVKPRKIPVSVG